MKEYTMIDLKRTIAHEWGHYIAYDILGYRQYNEGFEIESNIFGLFGHTTNFAQCVGIEIPTFEKLVILYSGVVSEGLYIGKTVAISYTDADKISELTDKKSLKTLARRKALELLSPYSNTIKILVAQTLNRIEEIDTIDFLSFYHRVFKDEALTMLNESRNSN